jgi:hypothetical protein
VNKNLKNEGLDRDAMTAFGAAAVEGFAAAHGGHPGPKAADAPSFPLGPFKGAFHDGRSPFSLDRLKFQFLQSVPYCGSGRFKCQVPKSAFRKKN